MMRKSVLLDDYRVSIADDTMNSVCVRVCKCVCVCTCVHACMCEKQRCCEERQRQIIAGTP